MVSTAAFHARVRGSVPGLGGLKETKLILPHPRVKVSIVGSLRDREVACSASDRQGSNFESCVWRTVSSQSSHHPQEVLMAQFSLYVHKGGLKPDSFHFIIFFHNFLVFSARSDATKGSNLPPIQYQNRPFVCIGALLCSVVWIPRGVSAYLISGQLLPFGFVQFSYDKLVYSFVGTTVFYYHFLFAMYKSMCM